MHALAVSLTSVLCCVAPGSSDAGTLVGRWRVDLRPTPEAEPYYQSFVVESVRDDTLAGSFYGSDIRNGRVNSSWGDVHFSFVTEDGSGEYHTSGVLRGGRLEGTTHSIGRAFMSPWRAIPEYAGVTLSPDEGREEVALLRRALETIHPGLHRYASAETIDAAFERLDDTVADGTTDVELYGAISLLIAEIRCGHTRAEAPAGLAEYRRRTPTHLPFSFRLFDGRMIVDAVDAGVPDLKRGQEIVSINGVPVGDLVERIGATVPVDGFVDSIRPSRLDTAYEFDDNGLEHYLPVFYGFRDDFTLEVLEAGPDTPADVTVRAITAGDKGDLAPKGPGSFADSVRAEPLGDDTLLLEVGTFINYRNTVDPEALFAPIFRDINAKGVAHLILDLRSNGGGSSDVSWTLARFLVDEPIRFKPPLLRNFRFDDELRPHLNTWVEGAMDMPAEAFRALPDGWFELRPEASGRVTEVPPHPDRFHGRVTVLIGPYNASGTTMLVAMLKGRKDVRLVGQPTGGSAEGPTAGLLFFLSLPRTGITVNIPAFRERTPGGSFAPNLGVAPDVVVRPTREDFLAGRDPVLDAALRSGVSPRRNP